VRYPAVDRTLTHPESHELLRMTAEFADDQLAPRAGQMEASGEFPRQTLREMGDLGLLTLPFEESIGGGGQGYEVYLQVLEELAARWVTVALAVSVHTLACHPLLTFGSPDAHGPLVVDLMTGSKLGAYCLSEAHAGSDPSAMHTTATQRGGDWIIRGTKAWVTHGGIADFYIVFARTSDDPRNGLSCFYVPADTRGLTAGLPEQKMGLTGSPTALMHFDDVSISRDLILGEPGDGLSIALSALDAGRLGIAAIAVGLAQAALDYATEYASGRQTFGHPIIKHQAVAFLLADMDAQTQAAREMYLAAARRKDSGRAFSREASIAKLLATDTAMRSTTDAVQVLGGAGYTRDHPVERYMREAKVMQIFEGTNQIQRLVIARHLERRARNHGK
jgi:alkylation response protein AidB-like acyl-CoA dehydrogenase